MKEIKKIKPFEEGKIYQTKFATGERFTVHKIDVNHSGKQIKCWGEYENNPGLLNCPLDPERLIPETEIIEKETEYILCAAIHFDDGKEYLYQPINIKTGLVFCAHRHAVIFQQIGGTVGERQNLGIYEKEQGFLTNLNRFVDRKEAMQIAKEAGQVPMNQSFDKLFSEDLY